jgi:hypothetical protein
MIKQVFLSQCGILFDSEALGRTNIIPPVVLAVPTSHIEEKESEVEAGVVVPTLRALPSSSGEDGGGEYMIPREDVAEQTWVREQDVLSDIHDELRIKPGWWVLEYLPMRLARRGADGTWYFKWGCAHSNSIPSSD